MGNPLNVLGQKIIDTGDYMYVIGTQFIAAALLIVIGWVVGSILGRAVGHIVRVLHIDKALAKAGVAELSEKAGVKISVEGFLSWVVKWLIVIAFASTAAQVINLTELTNILNQLVAYMPRVIIASVLLIVAALVADFVARIVEHSVKATGIQANFVASIARWAILIMAGILPALNQLSIVPGLVETLFTGIVFAVSLAIGLSFGLGGRDAAARTIEKMKIN